jgi:hypothetical protein
MLTGYAVLLCLDVAKALARNVLAADSARLEVFPGRGDTLRRNGFLVSPRRVSATCLCNRSFVPPLFPAEILRLSRCRVRASGQAAADTRCGAAVPVSALDTKEFPRVSLDDAVWRASDHSAGNSSVTNLPVLIGFAPLGARTSFCPYTKGSTFPCHGLFRFVTRSFERLQADSSRPCFAATHGGAREVTTPPPSLWQSWSNRRHDGRRIDVI